MAGLVATSAAAAPRDAEHQRIAAERAVANTRFTETQKACNRQFVVTSCVDAARREQRATLTRLRHEELALDDAKRAQDAEARRQAAAVKAEAQTGRAGAAASSASPLLPPREGLRRTPTPNHASHRSDSAASEATPASASNAARRDAEARHAAEFDARTRAAAGHRETIERRNADRAATGKQTQPLPVPGSAPASTP